MHIDDWLDTPSTTDEERYAKKCLEVARMPAITRWEMPESEQYFRLFCTYDNQRFRCTGASRLGDVWLTDRPEQKEGYMLRVDLADCSDWSDKPDHGNLGMSIAERAIKGVARKILTNGWAPTSVNLGRNAAKRARRAISKSYGGPAKTPKGLRGKE